MKYKVAVVQMEVAPRDKEKNMKKAFEFMEQAAQEGAKIVCFPDHFLTDTPTSDDTTEDIKKLAEPIPGPVTEKFAEKAKEYSIYVVAGTMFEKSEDGQLYLTSPVIDSNGKLIGKVRKSHMEYKVPAKWEIEVGLTPDPSTYPVINTEFGKIGVIDGISVETPIILGMKGADVLFYPYNISTRYNEYSLIMAKYYSIVSCAYVAVAGRVGWHKNVPVYTTDFFSEERRDLIFAGGGQIIFAGQTMAAVQDFFEGIAVTTVDTKLSKRYREQIYPVVFKNSSVFARYNPFKSHH